MGTLLRYPYEVRDEADYFEDIPNTASALPAAILDSTNAAVMRPPRARCTPPSIDHFACV